MYINKVIKQAVCTMLILTMVLTTSTTLGATIGANTQNLDTKFESVIKFIDGIYQGDSNYDASHVESVPVVSYQVFDAYDRDITDQFMGAISNPCLQTQKELAYNYILRHAATLIRRVETKELHALDITKTVEMDVVKLLFASEDSGYNGTVDYKVRGAIIYNPNTLLISSATVPIRTTMVYSGFYDLHVISAINETASRAIAPNKLSANFGHVLSIIGKDTFTLKTYHYGTINTNFTIIPD